MAKQTITCESCGKQYDYLKSEACPHCGAFNYVKRSHTHICSADDVERIIEMRSVGHADDIEDTQDYLHEHTSPAQIDPELQKKYDRIQEKLNRLGTSPEPRPSFEIDPRQTQRNDRPKKGNSGCLKPIGILMAVLILFNVIIPLIFGALKYVLFDRPSPAPEPVYPASESVIADEYVDGIPGYSYTVNDMSFIVGDMALLDTGDALDPEQAVVLVQTDAFCDLPVDEYAQVSVSTYLSDAGGAYYYSPIDMAAYEEDSLAQTLFNNYQFYFLQDFELSYLDGSDAVSGYMPFLVDRSELEELFYVLQLDYYNTETGTFQQHTVFYAFPLTDLQTISMEEAAALYYNTSY